MKVILEEIHVVHVDSVVVKCYKTDAKKPKFFNLEYDVDKKTCSVLEEDEVVYIHDLTYENFNFDVKYDKVVIKNWKNITDVQVSLNSPDYSGLL